MGDHKEVYDEDDSRRVEKRKCEDDTGLGLENDIDNIEVNKDVYDDVYGEELEYKCEDDDTGLGNDEDDEVLEAMTEAETTEKIGVLPVERGGGDRERVICRGDSLIKSDRVIRDEKAYRISDKRQVERPADCN